MPTTRRLASDAPAAEPVSLVLAKQWLRIDSTHEDLLLNALLKAAREKVENYLGLYFVGGQKLESTFTLDEPYSIPAGSAAESVRGFFTELADLTAWSLEEYRKGISIERQQPWPYAATQQTYTVTYQLPDAVEVPGVVVTAILQLAAEWYKNPEASVNGTISVATRVNWERMLAELRTTPIAY